MPLPVQWPLVWRQAIALMKAFFFNNLNQFPLGVFVRSARWFSCTVFYLVQFCNTSLYDYTYVFKRTLLA